jgi:hypothetical protein
MNRLQFFTAVWCTSLAVFANGTHFYNNSIPSLSFDRSQALLFAQFSHIAYQEGGAIFSWSCSECSSTSHDFAVSSVVSYSGDNLQAYVGFSASENLIVAAIRGTQEKSIENWIVDLNALETSPGVSYPSAPSSARVAAGFYNSYAHLKDSLLKVTSQLKYQHQTAQLVVTGHSLGAALAVYLALDIEIELGHSVALYTYGQPRVGNGEFATFVESRVSSRFRVVNYNDIVPHLVPELFGYHHDSVEYWILKLERGSPIKQCNGSGEDPSCANSIPIPECKVSSHFMTSYLNDLGA